MKQSVHTLKTSIFRSEGRWEHSVQTLRTSVLWSEGWWETVHRHSGPLKVRGEVGTKCLDTRDLYLKIRADVGDSVEPLRTSV